MYKNTGIQIQEFNTVYQFKSIKDSTDFFEKAKTFLMTPDYFNFLLTGEKYNEYTNFTTTGFYDVERDEINKKIISLLGIEEDLFPHMIKPGEYIGSLRREIIEDVGFNVKVIASASHDTASAVFSNNLEKELNTLYISSGTWSLVGTVNESPIININTFKDNFTNEGYINGRITFIKNIMGLWIIESLRKEYNSPSFEEINKKLEGIHLDTVIDINDIRFLSPESMTEEIDKYINEHNLSNVNSIWEKLYIVYNSLAYYYGETINEIEKHTNKKFDSVYIMGGGSQSDLLNRLTKKYTSKNIVIGYVEATAIGNLRIQMMYSLNLNFIDLNNIKIIEE